MSTKNNSKNIWDIEKIKLGFELFFKKNGRLPTALEIDQVDYLPASRTIQRSYGGLQQLRIQLGHEINHFGKGESRSVIAKALNVRGNEAEANIYNILKSKFGEMFVHVEKPFSRSSKQRLDFYVYSPDGNFGIDVFYPKDAHSLAGSLAIKQINYKNYVGKLYFIVANKEIQIEAIAAIAKNKKNLLKGNIILTNEQGLISDINTMNIYTVKDAE